MSHPSLFLSPAYSSRQVWCLILYWLGSHVALANEFFAMDTVARGEPAAVAKMLHELGYDGVGGTALDPGLPDAIGREGLRFYNGYHVVRFVGGQPAPDEKLRTWLDHMQGAQTVLWLAIEQVAPTGKPVLPLSSTEGDALAIEQLIRIAEYAKSRGTSVALYPHTGYWLARFEDAVRIADQLNRPDVGVTFNLCHWLKVEGSSEDPLPLIKSALPRLKFVTINGADTGDTRSMGWDRLIQPLDLGSFDVGNFVRQVRMLGYRGPFGFQGYGISGEPRAILQRTMTSWRAMSRSEP